MSLRLAFHDCVGGCDGCLNQEKFFTDLLALVTLALGTAWNPEPSRVLFGPNCNITKVTAMGNPWEEGQEWQFICLSSVGQWNVSLDDLLTVKYKLIYNKTFLKLFVAIHQKSKDHEATNS